MQNDISRQWALLTPFVPGEMLTAQAQQIESLGWPGSSSPRSTATRSWAWVRRRRHQRVQIASGIKIAFASNPFEIAMTAMDLDRLSGGRVVLGLGTSIKNWVEGFHGMPRYEKPVARLRESIQIIREVFAKSHIPGGLQTFEGRFHNHDWRTFLGAFAAAGPGDDPDLAAGQPEGPHPPGRRGGRRFIDHPIHGPQWTATHGRDALAEG